MYISIELMHIFFIQKLFFVLNAVSEINRHFRLAVFLYKYYSYEKKKSFLKCCLLIVYDTMMHVFYNKQYFPSMKYFCNIIEILVI